MASRDILHDRPILNLSWRNIRYSVQKGEVTKQILKGIDGHAFSGRVVAIMGSSGAGKTSLLNALSGRLKVGEVSGDVLVNGHPVDNDILDSYCGYVTQDDLMMETQTARELMHFSAALRLPKGTSAEIRTKIVNETLEMLNINHIADTVVGNPNLGGISGGERKRVNIGCQMVAKPSILFIDEVTSGLDSYVALEIIRNVRSLANLGETIIFTIHQPSTDIFLEFDELMLLHMGEIAYFGPAEKSIAYFENLGFPCPTFANPPEYILGVIIGQSRKKSDKDVDFGAEFKKTPLFTQSFALPSTIDPIKDKPPQFSRKPGYFTQFSQLARRNLRNYLRDRVGLRARLAQTIVFGTLLALIFANLEDNVSGVQDRSGVLFFSTISMGLTALLQSVLMFPFEKLLVIRETRDKAYFAGPYYIAKSLSEAPFQVLFPTIFSLILYFSADLRSGPEHFFIFVAVLICVAFTAQSIGLMVGAIAPSPQVAVALAPMSFVPFMLMGGLFANRDRLDPYWLWLEKLSFVAYGYEALMRNEMEGNCFASNGNCTISQSFTPAQAQLLDGDQIIKRFNFKLYIGLCFIALACIMVLFRIIGFLALKRQLSRNSIQNNINKEGTLKDALENISKFDLESANAQTRIAHGRKSHAMIDSIPMIDVNIKSIKASIDNSIFIDTV